MLFLVLAHGGPLLLDFECVQIYDMHELALSNIKTTAQFKATKGVQLMNRPVMLFQGDAFESDAQLSELKGLFLDMYQHQSLGKINLAGLEHAVVLTAKGSKVAFRHYSISLKKSGERVPKIQLEEIGPSFDMEVRRQQLPSSQVRLEWFSHTIRHRPAAKSFELVDRFMILCWSVGWMVARLDESFELCQLAHAAVATGQPHTLTHVSGSGMRSSRGRR